MSNLRRLLVHQSELRSSSGWVAGICCPSVGPLRIFLRWNGTLSYKHTVSYPISSPAKLLFISVARVVDWSADMGPLARSPAGLRRQGRSHSAFGSNRICATLTRATGRPSKGGAIRAEHDGKWSPPAHSRKKKIEFDTVKKYETCIFIYFIQVNIA